MTLSLDPVNVVNTALCAIILMLGCWGHKRNGSIVPLLIGIAFGVFGVSHVIMLLGLGKALLNFQIVIRTIAYLIVVFALARTALKR